MPVVAAEAAPVPEAPGLRDFLDRTARKQSAACTIQPQGTQVPQRADAEHPSKAVLQGASRYPQLAAQVLYLHRRVGMCESNFARAPNGHQVSEVGGVVVLA